MSEPRTEPGTGEALREALLGIVTRTATMGLCSQTHHEHLMVAAETVRRAALSAVTPAAPTGEERPKPNSVTARLASVLNHLGWSPPGYGDVELAAKVIEQLRENGLTVSGAVGNEERPDGRAVHAAWRDGMLAQGRRVPPLRMEWDTLPEEDRLLDEGIAARLAALATPEPGAAAHEPGESHRYRVECEVCGQRGSVVLSVEPQRASPAVTEAAPVLDAPVMRVYWSPEQIEAALLNLGPTGDKGEARVRSAAEAAIHVLRGGRLVLASQSVSESADQ